MTSVDRMICVVYPHKHKYISNKATIFGIILSLICLQLILNSANLFFEIKVLNVSNPLNNITKNVRLCTSSSRIVLIRDLMDELTRSVIPIIIQSSSSIIMICSLIKRRKNIKRSSLSEKDRKFAFTVMILNLFFLITQIPELIATFHLWKTGANKSSHIKTKKTMIAYFVYLLTVLFASLNLISVFAINLTFNKIYRKIFLELLQSTIRSQTLKIQLNTTRQSGSLKKSSQSFN